MKCSSCKIYHHHILCSLFILGLKAILLSGGLGFEDQPNDHCEVSILPHVIYFFVGLKYEVIRPNPRTLDELNNIFETLAAVPLQL